MNWPKFTPIEIVPDSRADTAVTRWRFHGWFVPGKITSLNRLTSAPVQADSEMVPHSETVAEDADALCAGESTKPTAMRSVNPHFEDILCKVFKFPFPLLLETRRLGGSGRRIRILFELGENQF